MTTQIEEVVLHPHPRHTQHLGEDRTQDLLPHRRAAPDPAPAGVLRAPAAPLRSSFPFAVSGSASSTTTADGTMYSGNRAATNLPHRL